MEKIFEGFNTSIYIEDSKYYIEYDEGHFVIKYVMQEISEDDAQRAQKSAKDSYEVIIKNQNDR